MSISLGELLAVNVRQSFRANLAISSSTIKYNLLNIVDILCQIAPFQRKLHPAAQLDSQLLKYLYRTQH